MNLAKRYSFPFDHLWVKIKKKQRKISFSEPLDMPPLKRFYPGLTKQKRSTTRCVPSSNSGDLCFFLFPFFCGVSSTRTKNNEKSISQNRLIGHAPLKSPLVIADTGFYETKRFFHEVGAFIHLWWSLLFSFSFFCLESLLREQIKKQREINFSESLDMPIYILKSLLGFYKTLKFCTKVRTFLQLLWFLLFPFSFFIWSFFYGNEKQRKINF